MNPELEQVAGLLSQSRSVLFITGAGISADSGLPTYRGIGGLYEEAVVDEGFTIETALSAWMMQMNPALVWKYIAQIERACRGTVHNRGHEVLAEMEAHFQRVWVLTQNVDGFHRAAGSKNVIDLHGDIHDLLCTGCGQRSRVADFGGLEIPPLCSGCGSMLRPDVVLFGELLATDKVHVMQRELERGFDLIFSIGTTSFLPYIAQPILEARRRGIPTVEINPGVTDVSGKVDVHLRMRALEALDALWSRCRSGG